MKFLRITGRVILGLFVLTALTLIVCLKPVDETPYHQTDFYRQTTHRLAALPRPMVPRGPLRAGWAKVNLTPGFTTPTGGYGIRQGRHWRVVQDSLWVRAIALDNGTAPVVLISLDLLICPPTVTEQLKRRLPELGLRWENVYIGATHSHNSLGGFAPGPVGRLFSGEFDPRIVDHITNTILRAIRLARQQLAPVTVGYADVDAPDLVYNRVVENGPVDGRIRLVKLQVIDNKPTRPNASALLCTFSGHATVMNMQADSLLTRDYPGALVDSLEARTGGFALFMAGAVGSSGPEVQGLDNAPGIRAYTNSLLARIGPVLPTLDTKIDNRLSLTTLPLSLREPQARILGNWCVRPFVFRALYGDFPADLKTLRIGPTVWLGTPCDFSAMLAAPLLDSATKQGDKLLITSFNGGYIGYVTPDRYYQNQSYETYTMNWFGPQSGAYFSELMTGLIGAVAYNANRATASPNRLK
jgi:neutral ceramidase